MKIFISYSSQDRSLVSPLVTDLGMLGHDVWYDLELAGGQSWWNTILEQIRRCDLFVYAVTSQILTSTTSKVELRYALDLDKTVLAVLLENVPIKTLPPELSKRQRIVNYEHQDKQQALALSKTLNGLPTTKPLPSSLPLEPNPPHVFDQVWFREQIKLLSTDLEEQLLLVARLADFLADKATRQSAREMLDLLLERDDVLLAKTYDEITRLLNRSNAPSRVRHVAVNTSSEV